MAPKHKHRGNCRRAHKYATPWPTSSTPGSRSNDHGFFARSTLSTVLDRHGHTLRLCLHTVGPPALALALSTHCRLAQAGCVGRQSHTRHTLATEGRRKSARRAGHTFIKASV